MDVKPFVLWGDSAIAAARERALAALGAWRGAWGIDSDRLGVECERAAAERHGESGWRGYRLAESVVAWMRLEDAASGGLEHAMFGSPAPAASLAAEIARDAREDLLATLLAALRGKPAPRGTLEPGLVPASLFKHGAGTLHFRIDAAGLLLELLVPHAELAPPARSAEPRSADAAALLALDAAMRGMPLKLQAQIGAIEIDFPALNRLVEGDVIRFGTKVEQPLAIVGPDGTTVFHGHLGVHDGVRALDLVN